MDFDSRCPNVTLIINDELMDKLVNVYDSDIENLRRALDFAQLNDMSTFKFLYIAASHTVEYTLDKAIKELQFYDYVKSLCNDKPVRISVRLEYST